MWLITITYCLTGKLTGYFSFTEIEPAQKRFQAIERLFRRHKDFRVEIKRREAK